MGVGRQRLLPGVWAVEDREALRFGERALSYRESGALAERVGNARRVAVWATPTLHTCAAVVPLNPKVGSRELEHIVRDSEPDLVLAEPGFAAPDGLRDIPGHEGDLDQRSRSLPEEPGEQQPALIVYTSGTTGAPKGARLLTPHKRPRAVHFLESLPRNDMGKVVKKALHV